MLRAALIAVSAFTAGREMLKGEVDKRKQTAIEAAIEEARERLDTSTNDVIARMMRSFLVGLAIKAGILAALYGAHFAELIDNTWFFWLATIALTLYLARDIYRALPWARPALEHIRAHGWRPKRALTEFIAAAVFDETLESAEAQLSEKSSNKFLLFLSGHKADELSIEVAGAVSHVARETSWDQIKPRVYVALAQFGVMSLLYSAYVFVMLRFA